MSTIAELEADLKAEWKNLEILIEKNKTLTSALRGLLIAVDHVEWNAEENRTTAALDDARSVARAALAAGKGE